MIPIERIYRARQIIIENPTWGRRKINAQLRSEFGVGLRDATIDKINKPYREAKKEVPEIKGIRPVRSMVQQAMKLAGFLSFEVHGVQGSNALGLGEVAPDPKHPTFRQTLERMIRIRQREYYPFVNRGKARGWSKAKIDARWRKVVLHHYSDGFFPFVGRATSKGGSYVTADGKPSPWALYKAVEQQIIRDAPFGGDAWGTPRPQKGKRHPDVVRETISRNSVEKQIKRYGHWINEVDYNIKKAKERGDKDRVRELTAQKGRMQKTVEKLKEKL